MYVTHLYRSNGQCGIFYTLETANVCKLLFHTCNTDFTGLHAYVFEQVILIKHHKLRSEIQNTDKQAEIVSVERCPVPR